MCHVFSYVGLSNIYLLGNSTIPRKYFAYTQNDFLAKEFFQQLNDANGLLFVPSNGWITSGTYMVVDDVLDLSDCYEFVDGELKYFCSKVEPQLQVLATDRIMDRFMEQVQFVLRTAEERTTDLSVIFDLAIILQLFCRSQYADKIVLPYSNVLTVLKEYGLTRNCSNKWFNILKRIDYVSYHYYFLYKQYGKTDWS